MAVSAVASLPALGPWAPTERGPSLESIYRVFLTVDLCEGNKIISLKKIISPQPVRGPSKRKKIRGPWARAQCAHWLRRPWVSDIYCLYCLLFVFGLFCSISPEEVKLWGESFDRLMQSSSKFKARLDKFWMPQDILYDYKADLTGIGDRSVHVTKDE